MSAMRLKSSASRLLTQSFIQGAHQRKHQSSASLTFVREIHRWPVNSPHKWPVTRKMFPFDDQESNNSKKCHLKFDLRAKMGSVALKHSVYEKEAWLPMLIEQIQPLVQLIMGRPPCNLEWPMYFDARTGRSLSLHLVWGDLIMTNQQLVRLVCLRLSIGPFQYEDAVSLL